MKLTDEFFHRDCLEVAPELIGKLLCRRTQDGSVIRYRITETEAYRGEQDTACHAHKGRTARTQTLYLEGGHIYVYLCYGIHWLMNIVTGEEDLPQAVLLRGVEGFSGPGRLTRAIAIDKSFNSVSITASPDVWIEDDGFTAGFDVTPRIGIGYASPEDQARLWRYVISSAINSSTNNAHVGAPRPRAKI